MELNVEEEGLQELFFLDAISYDQFEFNFVQHGHTQEIILHIQALSRDNQHQLKAEGKLIWPAAETLCKYIEKHQEEFLGKSILELGAGQGVAGMLCAHLSGKQSVLTDYDDETLALLKQNVDSNFSKPNTDPLENKPICHKLIWGNDQSLREIEDLFPNHFDIIIGSDIVYYKTAVIPLFQTVDRLLSRNPSSKFVLCNQHARLGMNLNEFQQATQTFQFKMEEVSLDSFLSEIPIEKTHLFIFQKQTTLNEK